MKINIAVVDSGLRQRNETVMMVDEYVQRRHLEAFLEGFRSGPELLKTITERGNFDVYIFETRMPDMNGIVLARELRARLDRGRILYYTADSTYAVQAFEVKAYNYILKPAAQEKFDAMLDDALESVENDRRSAVIEVRVSGGYHRIPMDNISYVNIVKRALCYHLKNGNSVKSILLRKRFIAAVEELLEQPSFFIAGAGLVINMDHVQTVGRSDVIMNNGERVVPPKKALRILNRMLSGRDAVQK